MNVLMNELTDRIDGSYLIDNCKDQSTIVTLANAIRQYKVISEGIRQGPVHKTIHSMVENRHALGIYEAAKNCRTDCGYDFSKESNIAETFTEKAFILLESYLKDHGLINKEG
jgi:hypothetical protein